jgi:hypothetical protein
VELVASVVLAVIVVELYAWLPRISEWLLELAVRQLRAEDRERCREEWKAQLDNLPNTVVRLVHALSLTAAATQINMDFCEDKLDELNQRLKHLHDIHHHSRESLQKTKQNAKIVGNNDILHLHLWEKSTTRAYKKCTTPTYN